MRPGWVLTAIPTALAAVIVMTAPASAGDSRDARAAGLSLFSAGRFAEAIPYFDQVIAQHPRDIDVLNKRGICHLRTEQPDKALADFDRVVEHSNRFSRSFGWGPIYSPNQTWLPQPILTPVFPQAHGNRGIALLMLGRNDEALASFTTATRLWDAPEFRNSLETSTTRAMIARGRAGAQEGLGQAYHRLGQNEQAVEAYTQAIALDPTDPNGFAGRGDSLSSLHLLDQAIADYTEAIRLDPAHSRAFAGRGIALADQGRDPDAIRDLSRAITLDPKFAMAYRFRGASFARTGQNEQAIADYDAVIALIPDDAGAYKDRGGVMARMGRFDAAITDLSESIRLDPKRASAYQNRGAAFNGLGQFERAIDDLSAAIRLSPENAGCYTNRGLAFFGAGRYDQAIVDLSEAVQLAPREAVVYFNRAEVFARLGMRDRALADYQDAVRLDPGLTAAQKALERLDGDGPTAPGAIRDPGMALQLESTEIARLEQRGNDRRERGDWYGALAEYNRAVLLDPKRPEIYVARGWSRLSAGVDGADFDARAYLALKGWRAGFSPYMVVLAVLGARAGGRPDQAERMLEEALANLPQRGWPIPIVRYLKSELTEAALLAAAAGVRQESEARLCIGLEHLRAGDTAGATAQLTWARDHGSAGSIAADVARATLERLIPPKP